MITTVGAEAPLEARIAVIHEAIDRLLAEHAPGGLVLEALYTEYRFPRTALQLAHARGVICLAARQRGVEVIAAGDDAIDVRPHSAGAAAGAALGRRRAAARSAPRRLAE